MGGTLKYERSFCLDGKKCCLARYNVLDFKNRIDSASKVVRGFTALEVTAGQQTYKIFLRSVNVKFPIFSLVLFHFLCSTGNSAIFINEFRPNPIGGDPTVELVELIATAGETSFTGFWGAIESDSATFDVQNSGPISVQFDQNGLATFDTGNIENPAFTFFISTADHSNAAAVGDITSSIDAIGIPDEASGDTLYGAVLGGTDFTFTGDEPRLVFRDGTSGELYAINDPDNGQVFDISGTDVLPGGTFDLDPFSETFGAVNPSFTAVPEPGSIALLGCIAATAGFRRRRA